ncbi:MAG TPA: response regulator [Planctomycetota bacterium]|nr:response regulator [Planctomycetota bacterium]
MHVSDFLILMVEDEEDQVLLTKLALEKANLVNPLRIISDGESAIAYLAGKGSFSDRTANPLPSLVLLDLKLPRLGGLGVLQWIRSQPSLQNLPVVILTASINPKDRELADRLKVNSYLCKPVDSEGILDMMKSIGMYWMILRKSQDVPEPLPDGRQGPRVLLVDADRERLSVVSEGLRRRSPALWSDLATDAGEALGLVSETFYEAVVIDRALAGEPDLGPLTELQSRRPGMRLYVLDSQNDPAFLRRTLQAGARDVVRKPADPTELVDTLHRLLAAPPPSAELAAAEATPTPAPRRAEHRNDTEILGDRVRFQKTSWELVKSAAKTQGMDQLIRAYWKPLYCFVRQKGFDNETSKDLIQGFLAEALERGTIAKADPGRGKFRTFLLTALTNYIKDWRKAAGRLKRGGGLAPLSLDFQDTERQYSIDIASGETPEATLNKAWAMSTLESCIQELQGRPLHLQAFRMAMNGATYAEIRKATGLSETAAKTAVFRLRQQLRDSVLRKVGDRSDATPQDEEAAMADFAALLR